MDESNARRAGALGVIAAYSFGQRGAPSASYQERASPPALRRRWGVGWTRVRRGHTAHLPREQVIWRGRRSGVFLLTSGWPLFAVLLVLQALGLAAPALGELALPSLLTMLLVLVTFTMWWAPARACRWMFHRYTVTEARVVKSSGVVRGRREEVELRNVVRIHVEQHGLIQKVLNLGNVELRTATGSLALVAIARPREVADAILAHVPVHETPGAVRAAHELMGVRGAVVDGSSGFVSRPLMFYTRPPTNIGAGGYPLAGAHYVTHSSLAGGRGSVAAVRQESHSQERRLAVAVAPLVADVPGIRGLSLLDAIAKARSAGLELLVVGERAMANCAPGRVLEQIPNPGVCRLTAPEVRVVLTTTCGIGQRP